MTMRHYADRVPESGVSRAPGLTANPVSSASDQLPRWLPPKPTRVRTLRAASTPTRHRESHALRCQPQRGCRQEGNGAGAQEQGQR
jgi:hypothetical protein